MLQRRNLPHNMGRNAICHFPPLKETTGEVSPIIIVPLSGHEPCSRIKYHLHITIVPRTSDESEFSTSCAQKKKRSKRGRMEMKCKPENQGDRKNHEASSQGLHCFMLQFNGLGNAADHASKSGSGPVRAR